MVTCPWKIHWGVSQESTTQCSKDDNHPEREHSGPAGNGVTVITWYPGDRRQYTGDWPGGCTKAGDCMLHNGHHGNCAPS
jgi:hypothetical protein